MEAEVAELKKQVAALQKEVSRVAGKSIPSSVYFTP
jgi:uncharacterized small protein (DUF1192 family)